MSTATESSIIWLLLSLAAFVGFGIQNFLYKVAAARNLHSRTVTFYFIVISTAALWLVLIFSSTSFQFSKTVVLLSVLDAIMFYITTLSRMEALKCIPVHLAFPLMRTSTLFVALSGVFFFDENFSIELALAIFLMICAACLISKGRENDRAVSSNYRLGLLLTVIALITSTGTNVVSKLAAEKTILIDYMTLANSLIIVLSYAEMRIISGETLRKPTLPEFYIALGLAITNLLAWFAYLYALKIGPLSATAVIVGMGFIVPIILASVFYREVLTKNRIIAIVCTMLSILLLKAT